MSIYKIIKYYLAALNNIIRLFKKKRIIIIINIDISTNYEILIYIRKSTSPLYGLYY